MTPFNNHKPGFSFIEIMIAIMLLAIFGSSLFITQSKMLAIVSKTHEAIINNLQYAAIIPELLIQKATLKKENKPLSSISINKKIDHPSMTIQAFVKKIPEKSELFKNFGNDLAFVTCNINRNEKTSSTTIFLFNPPIEKDKETKASGAA